MIHRPSLNFDDRPKGCKIQFLIFHYTECDLDLSLEILTKSKPPHRVSAHYLIDQTGECYALVPEDKRAWHAGKSAWKNETHLNNTSIGIELVNLGKEPFEEKQIARALLLAKDIMARHGIEPENVLGHSDIAPQRKDDPGAFFPWKALAKEGVGIFPDAVFPCDPPEISKIQKDLSTLGYEIQKTGKNDPQTRDAVRAFQRHFSPHRLDGVMDALTYGYLKAVLTLVHRELMGTAQRSGPKETA